MRGTLYKFLCVSKVRVSCKAFLWDHHLFPGTSIVQMSDIVTLHKFHLANKSDFFLSSKYYYPCPPPPPPGEKYHFPSNPPLKWLSGIQSLSWFNHSVLPSKGLSLTASITKSDINMSCQVFPHVEGRSPYQSGWAASGFPLLVLSAGGQRSWWEPGVKKLRPTLAVIRIRQPRNKIDLYHLNSKGE